MTPILLGAILNHLQATFIEGGQLDRNYLIRIVVILVMMYVVLSISDILKSLSTIIFAFFPIIIHLLRNLG